MKIEKINLEQACNYIAAMDLNYIVEAMCAPNYPLPRWTRQDAEQCAQLYKNFLFLQKKYAPIMLVPTREIDEFWHNHILYTEQYFKDCQNIFAYYLHHAPAATDAHPEKLVQAYLQTKQLYFETFNEPLTSGITSD